MNKDEGAGFFSGLVMGALIGLAIGFLYAPQTGEDTRRVAKEKMKATGNRIAKDFEGDWRNSAKEKIKEVKNKIAKNSEDVKDEVKGFVNEEE